MTAPEVHLQTQGRKIGDVVLSVESVSLSFGGVKALSDVSFDVRRNEVRAIIGPNGAGKSSMLNVLNGVYHPQQGKIRFQGREFSDMDRHEAAVMGIARTFQGLALFRGMSVLDNIMAGRNLRMKSGILAQALRIGPAEREEIRHREEVERIIDFLELQPYRKAAAGQLPYGVQKRVDLGRALASEPRLLLLDEPFSALDALTRITMHRLVVSLWDRHRPAVLLVTHDVDEALALADRVLVLGEGRIAHSSPITLPRPRVRDHPDLVALRLKLLTQLGVPAGDTD